MLTVSIGIAPTDTQYHETMNENFWQLADEALYEAKRTGKNKTVIKNMNEDI